MSTPNVTWNRFTKSAHVVAGLCIVQGCHGATRGVCMSCNKRIEDAIDIIKSGDVDRELLVETLGWLKSYGFENKPHQFNGLIGRIERQVGTGWEARGATPPEPPSMTAPRERCQD